MKTVCKVFLIIACSAIALGILSFTVVGIAVGWNYRKISNTKTETHTWQSRETVNKITVNTYISDISFRSGNPGEIKVVYNDSDKMPHKIDLKNGVLEITQTDERKWYEFFGLSFFENYDITVYLPEKDYESLTVKNQSGDISTDAELCFGSVTAETASGDIRFSSETKKELRLKSISGDICAVKVNAGELSVNTTSGDIDLTDIQCRTLDVKSTSGDIDLIRIKIEESLYLHGTSSDLRLERCTAGGEVIAQTVSGDIELLDSDGASLSFTTVSGDVEGSILTPKEFYTATVSGSVRVPQHTTGNRCDIRTTSGDIRISVLSDPEFTEK